MTRGAQAAWAEINQRLRSAASSLLWVIGPAGSGKTHFLSYVLALSARAGVLDSSPGRHLTIAVSEAEEITVLERRLAEIIARQLVTSDKSYALWRELPDADALRVALDQARRQGVRSITAAIDFGLANRTLLTACEEVMIRLVKSAQEPKLTLIAAARDTPSQAEITVCEIAPESSEEALIAITRARCLDAKFNVQYTDSGKSGDFSVDPFFPFHPLTIAALLRLAPEQHRIAAIARIACEALSNWREKDQSSGVIRPSWLNRLPSVRELINQRLDGSGIVALRIANAAAAAMEEPRRTIAQEAVDLLELHCSTDTSMLLELRALIQALPAQHLEESEIFAVVEELARRSSGVILFDPAARQLRLNIHAADAPEIAIFNASLYLIRRFDPVLLQVANQAELHTALTRLRIALGQALEGACRNRDILLDLARQSGASLNAEQSDALNDFIALVEKGPAGLLISQEHPEQRDNLRRIIDDYDELAVLAAAAPRVHAMREYLLGMHLHEILLDELNRDPGLVRLETECKIMIVEVNAVVHIRSAALLDALEARFERFKWTYTTHYRAAHEEWRNELKEIAAIIEEGEKYRLALSRLEKIPMLRADTELPAEFAVLSRRVTQCNLQGRLAPEIMPLCPSCKFVIGTPSPLKNLEDITARMKRLLEAKLAILSQNAIRRLIHYHHRNDRLEGFLKITQAAQAGALIEMLDDELVAYLAELLDEDPAVEEKRALTKIVRPLGAVQRLERSGKASPRRRGG